MAVESLGILPVIFLHLLNQILTIRYGRLRIQLFLLGLLSQWTPKYRRYLFFKTGKEVWDVAQRIYSDLCNAYQIFKICTKLGEIKEGNNTVTHYILDQQDLWQERNLYLETTPLCTDCSVE